MSQTGSLSMLRQGHRKALGLEDAPPEDLGPVPEVPSVAGQADRMALLSSTPKAVVHKAWFTTAHLLLDPGARVADMDCGQGLMTHAMAALNPDLQFVGIEKDRRRVMRARARLKLPNLTFRAIDPKQDSLGVETFDAIINSYTLHEIYSQEHYSEQAVRETLRRQFEALKPEGLMFIEDYASPSVDDFVQLEIDDDPGVDEEEGEDDASPPEQDVDEMSDADLLVWYAEQARPSQTPGCRGFYLEELPSRFPRTRLFRLPYKWAYEFILRKHNRREIERTVSREYTFFTRADYRKELRALGARVLYATPYWDEGLLRKGMLNCRLFADDGSAIVPPPAGYIAVAQKIGEGRSLVVQERRPSRDPANTIRIMTLRDQEEGRIVDVACPVIPIEEKDDGGKTQVLGYRPAAFTEILPWRIAADGRLKICVMEGAPRAIVNAIPRMGRSLDGKRWSGHMIEAVSVERSVFHDIEAGGPVAVARFCVDSLGVRPTLRPVFEEGPPFYPAPDYIDEKIETRLLRIEDPPDPEGGHVLSVKGTPGFTTSGRVRELDAQSLLDAIRVGFVPNSRLEMQILFLFRKLGMKTNGVFEIPIRLQEAPGIESVSAFDLMRELEAEDDRFEETKGSAGQLRLVHSIFVDEGYAEGGVMGLGARGMDFVIPDDDTVNTAVVLPLARSISGEVMAGVVTRYLPVPQRYERSGLTLTVPSFALPRSVRTLWEARKYIAEQFEVKPENVVRMGESYFCHAGLTPHRVYPFAVSVTAKPSSGPGSLTRFSPLRGLWKMLYRIVKAHQSYMKVISEAYQTLGVNSDMSLGREFGLKLADRKAAPVSVTNADIIGEEDHIRVLPASESSVREEGGGVLSTRAVFGRDAGLAPKPRVSDPGVEEEGRDEDLPVSADPVSVRSARKEKEDRDLMLLQALRNE